MYENKNTLQSKLFQGTLIIICFILSAICIIPIMNVIAISLSSPEAILQGRVSLIPVEPTFEAYSKVLSGPFLHSLIYTIFLTVVFTGIAMVMTILCAYPLSRSDLKGKKYIMYFILFVMYFNAGTIPNYMVVRDFGLLNSTWSLILPCMLSAYNMIIMKNFFQSIDGSILESAEMDGCSEFGLLFRIILPLSKAVIATIALFYAVYRWNLVEDSIYYISDPSKYPLQAVLKEIILSEQSSSMDMGMSSGVSKTVGESVKSASIVLSTIPILVVYPFIQKHFTKGIMLGSVKG